MNKEKIYEKAETKAAAVLCEVKCLCPEWKAAGMCSDCDVFMGLREYYASRDCKDLDDCTWAEIAEISASGKAADIFSVGDFKTVTLYTGEIIKIVVLGFNHDVLNETGNAAGITLGLRDMLDGEYEINENYTTAGGWDKSKMRNTYMQRFFKVLPNDLQSVIKTVDKKTGAGGGSTDIVTSQDKLFLFSQVEVIDDDTYTAKDEGKQYEYFADNDDNCTKNRGGSARYWWLRSPSASNSTSFRCIYSTGCVINSFASIANGVSFGFCI